MQAKGVKVDYVFKRKETALDGSLSSKQNDGGAERQCITSFFCCFQEL